MKRIITSIALLLAALAPLSGKPDAPTAAPIKRAAVKPALPAPTLPAVPYGPHPKQVLHFWKAESEGPAPLLFFIHGGGWMGGDYKRVSALLRPMLDAGISVVSIEYRFISHAMEEGITPPVKAPLHDAARALQFVRSKAAEWNIDKTRIAASGNSAGACTSLWLAFHDDMADPNSADPVARESTRLLCAAVNGAQTTLDPAQMREWTPNSKYGGHAFGILKGIKGRPPVAVPGHYVHDFDAFLARREELLPMIREYSPYAQLTADDPPVYLFYMKPPAIGQPQQDHTHTSNFGLKLQEKMKATGVACELVYPSAADVRHATTVQYLISSLKAR